MLRLSAPGLPRLAAGSCVDHRLQPHLVRHRSPGWDRSHGGRGAALTWPVPGPGRLAVVNCLNFGNPEHPEVMWQLSEAIDGMRDACVALGLPVIGGNVSLYNESDGADIDPTPVIGTLGLIDQLAAHPSSGGHPGGGCLAGPARRQCGSLHRLAEPSFAGRIEVGGRVPGPSPGDICRSSTSAVTAGWSSWSPSWWAGIWPRRMWNRRPGWSPVSTTCRQVDWAWPCRSSRSTRASDCGCRHRRPPRAVHRSPVARWWCAPPATPS